MILSCGIFAEYSEIYYESPNETSSIHYKDHKAYLNSGNNIPSNNKTESNIPYMEHNIRFIPNIEIYKRVDSDDLNDAILIKTLRLK